MTVVRARRIVDAVDLDSPGVTHLASLLSFAVRIEPELVRGVRLAAAPHLDAGVEADLWFSKLVGSRGSDAISFDADIADLLRERLRGLPDQRGVERAWRTIERLHAATSPALALEERIASATILAHPNSRAEIDHELDRALATLDARPRASVARWAAAAWPRLPVDVRAMPRAVHLREAALELVRPTLGSGGSQPVRGLTELVADRDRTTLRIRRAGTSIRLGALPAAGAVAVSLPDLDPLVVELRRSSDGTLTRTSVAVAAGEIEIRDVGTSTVQLLTLAGDVFELPPPDRPRIRMAYDNDSVAGDVMERLVQELNFLDLSGDESRSSVLHFEVSAGAPSPAVSSEAGPVDGLLALDAGTKTSSSRIDHDIRKTLADRLPVVAVLLGGDRDVAGVTRGMRWLDLRPEMRRWPSSSPAVIEAIVAAAELAFGVAEGGVAAASPSLAPAPSTDPTGSNGAASDRRSVERRTFELAFDAEGWLREGDAERLLSGLRSTGARDLFLFAHGWNQDSDDARTGFARLFSLVEMLRSKGDWDPQSPPPAYAGVMWPSMRWGGDGDATDPLDDFREAFPRPDQRAAVEELGSLLRRQLASSSELERSKDLMSSLSTHLPREAEPTHTGQPDALAGEARDVFERMAAAGPDETLESTGRVSNGFGRLWQGAKNALRVLTFWEMLSRADRVGSDGLAPLLDLLAREAPDVRLHVIGHSLGARVAARSLAERAEDHDAVAGSLVLLQAALSHSAFARPATLARVVERVDGPLIATHARTDQAMGVFYPLMARLGRSGGADTVDSAERYGALGFTGFRGVSATQTKLDPVGASYSLRPRQFYSVDCGSLLVSHADIMRPEIAWLILQAARPSEEPDWWSPSSSSSDG